MLEQGSCRSVQMNKPYWTSKMIKENHSYTTEKIFPLEVAWVIGIGLPQNW